MTAGGQPLSEKWRRFRRRPPEDRTLILRAVLFLALTRAGLRLLGFLRWKRVLVSLSRRPRLPRILPVEALRETAVRAARAVRSAELHGPANPNCLERSLTLWWLLRRSGVDSELHIGARKEGARLEAHAWVELAGQVLNDGAEVYQRYARFDAPIATAESDPRFRGDVSRVAAKTGLK
jgi:hypothetical protein